MSVVRAVMVVIDHVRSILCHRIFVLIGQNVLGTIGEEKETITSVKSSHFSKLTNYLF